MSRLLYEAVLIEDRGGLNSKNEWRCNKRPKLMVEIVDKRKRIEKHNNDMMDEDRENRELEMFIERINGDKVRKCNGDVEKKIADEKEKMWWDVRIM